MFLGIVQLASNRADQGIAECEHALALNRNLADAHGSLGAAKLFVGRATETEAHVQEALRGMLSPKHTAWFTAELLDQVPGKLVRIRIMAVRHALSPLDPWGRTKVRLSSLPSNEITACALGEMRAPDSFTARVVSARTVELAWRNRDDSYAAIEIRRRGQYLFSRIKTAGEHERHLDSASDAEPGEIWSYELVAVGYGRTVSAGFKA